MFEVCPSLIYRVKFRSIGWKLFDFDSCVLVKECKHLFSAVYRTSITHKSYRPSKSAANSPYEPDYGVAAKICVIVQKLKAKTKMLSCGTNRNCADYGDASVRVRNFDNRWLSAG